MNVLAFESSCDECSVSVLRNGKVVSLVTRTQDIHRQFGGVVPELAGRSHLQLIDELCGTALRESAISLSEIDVVAATAGPGLIGSLLVGFQYAQGLALASSIPFRPIHHMEAHLWSPEIESPDIPLPFLVLLVSGGHTMLVLVNELRGYEILGSTLDDALGEAYDKVGKVAGLSFPAGADVDRLAKSGDVSAFDFPVAMKDATLNFSFSGLKTAFLQKFNGLANAKDSIPDLLASFQESALQSVMNKIQIALDKYSPRALCAAGGVSANSRLRELMKKSANNMNIPLFLPSLKYCADNAAMIGYLAHKLENANVPRPAFSAAQPRWSLNALMETGNV